MGTSNGCMAILCTKKLYSLQTAVSSLACIQHIHSQSVIAYIDNDIVHISTLHTHRWSCNTQAVSNFAKDWIEPIVDKFKLPVGIGELIDWQL